MATVINCLNCGSEGILLKKDRQQGAKAKNIFKSLGRNPLSGHLHYQCPVCEIVLLVEPSKVHSLFPFFTGRAKAPAGEGTALYRELSPEGFLTPRVGAAPSVSVPSYR